MNPSLDRIELLPRCCGAHSDWPTLARHLVDDFAGLATEEVAQEIARAKSAVETVALGGADGLFVGELIARSQLLLKIGRVPDTARLDPQKHQRKLGVPGADPGPSQPVAGVAAR